MNEGYKPVDPRGAVLSFNQGAQAVEAGDEQTAVRAWQRALELDGALVPAALNLVTYYQKRGDLQGELQYWNHVIAYDPYNTDHLILQAAVLRQLKQYQRALDNYRRAISIYPYFKFWYHELADIYEELGDLREAAAWRQRGDSLQADEAEICYEDGVRHALEGRWESARTHFEAVLEDFPANLDARLRLAEALEMCHQTDEALRQYLLAIELSEAGKGLVFYRLGEYLLRLGRLEQAHRAFFDASRTAPLYYRAARAQLEVEEALRKQQQAQAAPPRPATQPQTGPPLAQITRPAEPAAPPLASGLPRTEQWMEVQFSEAAPEEPRLLTPEEIEMEPVEEAAPTLAGLPVFTTLNTQLPWHYQLRQVLDQALSGLDPAGLEPRVAIAFEPDVTLSGALSLILSELKAAHRKLRADAQESHILLIQATGADPRRWEDGVSYGWLGREEHVSLDPDRWGKRFEQIGLARILECAHRAGGKRGFSCLLLVSAGRRRPEAFDPRTVAQQIPLHAFCFIHPRYHYIDVRLALQESVSNYMEITL
ncbi:MAG: tetratricopeptide repeat protein [Bradymonadales bacterium]|nr:tetratricopeptide repeat protein [Bradymonadales bacterium]